MIANPEQEFFKRYRTETKALPPTLEQFLMNGKLYAKYIQPYEEERPDPESFAGEPGFSKERVEADLAKLNEVERRIGKVQVHDIAQIAQGLLYYLLSKRFGPTIDAVPTSHYDDIFGQVDLVLEIKEREHARPVRIGIDVATSQDEHPEVIGPGSQTDIGHKLGDILDELASGKIGRLEYFHSEPEPPSALLLPKTVVPLSRKQLEEIAGAVLTNTPTSPELKEYVWSLLARQLEDGGRKLKGLRTNYKVPKYRLGENLYETALKAVEGQRSGTIPKALTPQGPVHKF